MHYSISAVFFAVYSDIGQWNYLRKREPGWMLCNGFGSGYKMKSSVCSGRTVLSPPVGRPAVRTQPADRAHRDSAARLPQHKKTAVPVGTTVFYLSEGLRRWPFLPKRIFCGQPYSCAANPSPQPGRSSWWQRAAPLPCFLPKQWRHSPS